MKRAIFTTLAVLWAVLLLTACAGETDDETLYAAEGNILLGVVYPCEQNDKNTYLRQGIELAIAEVNEGGGVLGKPLMAVFEDDKNDGNKALEIAQKFIKNNIPAVIGHWSSNICYTVEDTYNDNQTVMIMPCATSKSVFEKDYDYIFRMCGNSDDYAAAIAADINARGYDNIAIAYSDDVYGADFANRMELALMEYGIDVIDRINNLSDANAGKIADRWNAFGCGGVIIGHVVPANVEIIQTIRDMGKDYPIWGADNFQRSNFATLLGGDVSNLYRVENDYASTDSDFLEAFRNKNGCDPDIFAVAGYDAVKLISNAMNASGSTDPTELAAYLRSLKDYPSVSGMLSYDQSTQEFTGHRVRVSPVAE